MYVSALISSEFSVLKVPQDEEVVMGICCQRNTFITWDKSVATVAQCAQENHGSVPQTGYMEGLPSTEGLR